MKRTLLIATLLTLWRPALRAAVLGMCLVIFPSCIPRGAPRSMACFGSNPPANCPTEQSMDAFMFRGPSMGERAVATLLLGVEVVVRPFTDLEFQAALATAVAESYPTEHTVQAMLDARSAAWRATRAPEAVFDCTESRARVPSGFAGDAPCTPVDQHAPIR